jgi:uncharacterized MAPEG superfamily protein
MTTELFYVVLTAVLTGCLWVPYVTGLVLTRGPLRADDYVTAPTGPLPDWVNRANRAHQNAVENFAPFAAVVIIAHALGISTSVTAGAAAAYFWLRLAHAVAHLSGFKHLAARTVIFTLGWIAFLVLAIEVLRKAA